MDFKMSIPWKTVSVINFGPYTQYSIFLVCVCVWKEKRQKQQAREMSAITLLFRIENQIETTSREVYRNNTELLDCFFFLLVFNA